MKDIMKDAIKRVLARRPTFAHGDGRRLKGFAKFTLGFAGGLFALSTLCLVLQALGVNLGW